MQDQFSKINAKMDCSHCCYRIILTAGMLQIMMPTLPIHWSHQRLPAIFWNLFSLLQTWRSLWQMQRTWVEARLPRKRKSYSLCLTSRRGCTEVSWSVPWSLMLAKKKKKYNAFYVAGPIVTAIFGGAIWAFSNKWNGAWPVSFLNLFLYDIFYSVNEAPSAMWPNSDLCQNCSITECPDIGSCHLSG